MTSHLPDYYKVLEIDHAASDKDIKAAYHSLAKKHHPDLNPSPNAAQKFREIKEAYEVLSNKLSRRDYDLQYSVMHGRGRRPPQGGPRYDSPMYGDANGPGYDYATWNRMHYGPSQEEVWAARFQSYQEATRRAQAAGSEWYTDKGTREEIRRFRAAFTSYGEYTEELKRHQSKYNPLTRQLAFLAIAGLSVWALNTIIHHYHKSGLVPSYSADRSNPYR